MICWTNSEYNNRTASNQPQCGGGVDGVGICILTDLGTYNNFIKPFTNFNSVLYSLHG